MNYNKIFKNIECNIINDNNRIYVEIDDLSKIIYDLCFTKSSMDVHTLRVIKRLVESIKKTYKILAMSEDFDINENASIVELSKKKIKKLVDNTYLLSQKDNVIESNYDSLDEDLSIENELIKITKEDINSMIDKAIKEAVSNIKIEYPAVKEDTVTKIVKKETKKRNNKVEYKEQYDEDDLEALADELDNLTSE